MEKEKKEVEVVQEKEIAVQQVLSPAQAAVSLLAKGVRPEDLEKMLMLQERYEANQARKAYYESMAVVQKNIPSVEKDLENLQTRSKYAALGKIIARTKPIYTAEGFSISFYGGDTEKLEHIRVYADVKHKLGHQETFHYDVPMDGKGLRGNANMTPIHAKASSVSYGERYLMCMIWNIPTGDDDDGNAAGKGVDYITEDNVLDLEALLSETKSDKKKYLAYMKVYQLSDIQAKDYKRAVEVLVAKQRKLSEKVETVDVEKEGK